MTVQTWSWIYLVSAVPTFMILMRTSRIKGAAAKLSRRYYSACISFLLVWTALDLVATSLPKDMGVVAAIVNRAIFIIVPIVVYCFVTSTIYFTRAPQIPETIFVGSPLIFMAVINIVDPFSQAFTSYGWQGDISNEFLRYSWLLLLIIVMIYSYLRLLKIRSRISDRDTRRRLTFFLLSFVIALIAGAGLYLLSQFVAIPAFSSIGVNISLLLSYPAFSAPAKKNVRQ